jgi:hypothetical protein
VIATITTALVAAAVTAATTSFSWFVGTWNCTSTYGPSVWHIHAPDAGGWSHLDYGVDGVFGGNAVVGHMPALKSWIYDDFHADGSFARNVAADPAGTLWIWRGTYYPPHRAKPLMGKVEWRVKSDARFDMFFYPPDASKTNVPSGSQSCDRRA